MNYLRYMLPLLLGSPCLLPAQPGAVRNSNPIKEILRNHPQYFGEILANPAKYEVQIMYTQIDRRYDNLPNFRRFSYGLDEGRYFYPAGTVALPTALAALERLAQLGIPGLDRHTTMLTGQGRDGQTAYEVDTLAPGGRPTVGQYVEEMCVAADANAFDRLYELLGQGYLNHQLQALGYRNSRIVHRQRGQLSAAEETYTNPVRFLRDSQVVYQQELVRSEANQSLDLTGTQRGVAYLRPDGQRVEAPFDFSEKNFLSLRVLHDMLQNLVLPELADPASLFRQPEDDYHHLLRCLGMLPRESSIAAYQQLPDNTAKFLLFGDRPQDTIPGHIRIFNASGAGYGFLTDVAYVVDFKNKVEFLLAATIHVNADGVYNDGQYEYEKIGLPFMGNLGRLIYELELQRSRQFKPDLRKLELGWGR